MRNIYTHYIGGSVDPRIGLNLLEKVKISCPTGIRTAALLACAPNIVVH